MEYRASISTKLMVLSEPASSELVWSDESVSRSTDGGDGMLQRSGSPAGSGRIRMRSFLLPCPLSSHQIDAVFGQRIIFELTSLMTQANQNAVMLLFFSCL